MKSLGPDQRIKKKKEFELLFEKGRSAKGKWLMLWAAEKKTQKRPHCGVVVSRKISLKATERNLWKRRMREAFRINQQRFHPGLSVLIKARAAGKAPAYQEIEQELKNLLKKLGYLK